MTDRLLSIAELAAKWGWKYDRLYRLVKLRAIPFVRIARTHYFREAEVEAWLQAQSTPATTTVSAKDAAAARAVRRSRREEYEAFGLEPHDVVV